MTELATLTTTPYITSFSVTNLLDKERVNVEGKYTTSDSETALNINRTLNEITNDIIYQVLDKNEGNQCATAKQLGISRTTLWRYLNHS